MAIFNYADKKEQLDEIVSWFDQEDIDFDQASEKFALAQKLISEINKYLSDKSAELKVKVEHKK